LIWRVGIGYWFFAILLLFPTILFGSLVNPLFGGDAVSFSDVKPTLNIVPMFIIFVVVAGLGQELGWTGLLMPRLQARFDALGACVIRAVIGTIWHLPLFIYSTLWPSAFPDFPYAGWIAQKGFLAAMMAALVFLLSWSILLGWMFNNTRGSLLLVSVLHGSEIWVAYWMSSAGIDSNNLDNYWGYGVVIILIAIVIVVTTGSQNLSRKHKRIVCQSSVE
jgi:membrane protease YdiL (CAAX protease family)